MLDVFLATMAFAIASFSIMVISLRASSQATSPLLLLLSSLLALSCGPIIFQLVPSLIQFYISLLPFIFFSLLPSLWFYHQALIAETPWQWRNNMWKHFAALPFVLILGLALFLLSPEEFHGMFFTSQTESATDIPLLSLAFFCTLIAWCVLSCFYIGNIIKGTIAYRQRLKHIYSHQEGRDLKWLIAVSVLIIITWIYSLIVLATENDLQHIGISENGVLVLLAIIVWLVSANGLRQRPGFEDSIIEKATTRPSDDKKAYERSGLTDDNIASIAEKLSIAITQDNVHLDTELTLSKLSEKLGEQPQYISQTLSQGLSTNFFDFINKARIEDAKKQLMESNLSVLDTALATGFNSRSSFYKAFKQFTGMTPSQFRKS